MVAVSDDRIPVAQAGTRADVERVLFVGMQMLGANPARMISAWREFVSDIRPTPAVPCEHRRTGMAEGKREELGECEASEVLLNLAFAGGPDWRLLCPMT